MAELEKVIDVLYVLSPVHWIYFSSTLWRPLVKRWLAPRESMEMAKSMILRMFLKKTSPLCHGSEVPLILLNSRWGASMSPLPLPLH